MMTDDPMSYLKGSTDKPLTATTFSQFFDKVKLKRKDKLFLISRHENKTATFGETIDEAENLALGLIQFGLQIGDKIGIIVNNCIEAFVINLACAVGGFVSVNLNPSLQPRELEYYIKSAEIKCIISLDKYRTYSVLDVLKKVIPELGETENITVQSKKVPLLKLIVIISDNDYKGTANYHDIKSVGKKIPSEHIKNHQKKISCHDFYTILYTSGTTGDPKPLGLTPYQMINCSNFLATQMDLHEIEHRFAFHFPFFHLFGQLSILVSLQSGTTMVLPSFYYNAEENLKAMSEEKCTYLIGSPTMLVDVIIIQKEKKMPLFLKIALTGSALSPVNLMKDLKEILKVNKIGILYGSSEALINTWNWLNYEEGESSSVLGYCVEHVELKVVDNNDKIVPIGTVGNLCVKGYSVISSYLNSNSKSEFLDDGWYKTGDAVYIDTTKKVHIAGRLKEIINRGGEKISPAEVEEILETHPDILEVGVVGTYHERLGEEVCACLKIKPESTITLNDIKNFCHGKLAYYKIPSRLYLVEEFPKTNLGKLQRLKLLDQINKTFITRNG